MPPILKNLKTCLQCTGIGCEFCNNQGVIRVIPEDELKTCCPDCTHHNNPYTNVCRGCGTYGEYCRNFSEEKCCEPPISLTKQEHETIVRLVRLQTIQDTVKKCSQVARERLNSGTIWGLVEAIEEIAKIEGGDLDGR